MAQSRLPMRKIRNVLRMSAAGLSKRQIAAGLGIGPTPAGACLRRAREVGIGVNRRRTFTPDRRLKLPHIVRTCSGSESGAVERSGTAKGSEPEARFGYRVAVQALQARFLKRQLSLPVSTISQ